MTNRTVGRVGQAFPLDLPHTHDRREADSGPSAALRPARRSGILGWLLALPLTLLLIAPLAALVWRGLSHPESVTPATLATLRQALTLSLTTSAVSLVVIALGGLPLAYAIARRGGPLARALEVLVDLPIVLPPSVAGIALLLAFGRNGVIGRWLADMGIALGFTTAAVVLAQIFVAAPFFVRAASAAFRRIDRSVEESASDLGASPRAVFRTITLPLAAPGLVAGLVLAWARALGEFGATIMFAGNFPGITQTMPLAIYAQYGAGDLETAVLLSFALLVASALTLAGVRALTGQNVGVARDL
ncbi:MAG: molybdate ABC transporter permease subunit [Thermomicrobiales bacterium]|nr:molybdate ABC transporter permease subunit [Thermomicrobiales bacterium]